MKAVVMVVEVAAAEVPAVTLIHATGRASGNNEIVFKGLAQRLRQMTKMSKNDPTWDGHVTAIENLKTAIRNTLDEWTDNDCVDPPAGVVTDLNRPVLSYEDVKALSQANQIANFTLQTALGAAGIYVGYRAIRLLPSLLPPL